MKVPFVDLKALHDEISDELREVFDRVLNNSAFVLGPEVQQFERDFAAYIGTDHCVAVNTGTAALHLALAALDIGPGDEVITVPHTFIATAEAISAVGARPVFVDIDPTSLTMDPGLLEAAITSKTEEAIKELEDTAHSSPKEPVLHFELGYLYYKQSEYDKASSELHQEILNNPGYAQSYLYLGDIALHSNDDKSALELLQKSLQLQARSRLAYFDLGCVYVNQGKPQEAVKAFQHAIQLDPSQPDAHYRLARVYMSLGQKKKAEEELANTKALHKKTDDTLIEKVSGDKVTQ